mgnify:CR=1 FL=1|jgi:hypothetical protein
MAFDAGRIELGMMKKVEGMSEIWMSSVGVSRSRDCVDGTMKRVGLNRRKKRWDRFVRFDLIY